MSGYLIKNDYKTYIQGDYLRQLTQADDDRRVIEERAAMSEIITRLTQKYDLDLEFKTLTAWDSSKAYGAGDRVYIDASATGFVLWVASAAYAVGAPVYYNGYGYYCLTANSDATFTPSKWTQVGAQYSIYYGAFPSSCTVNGQPNPSTLTQPYAPVFNYKTIYTKGDIVFWRNNTYVCAQDSTVINHQAALQYAQYTNIPYNNVWPDDPLLNNSGQYWKDATVYTITPGTKLTDAAWTEGDNRYQTIKDAMIMLTVFKLSPLIAPMNRPDVWLDNYRSALREMNDAAKGEITYLLPLKQPNNATRTYNGGNIKNINSY